MNMTSVKILIIILSSFLASQFQSSWGKVNIQRLKIPTQNGQWVVADLFKPYSASHENPAPIVIVIPGFQRSKETLSNIAIELSRRGIVVISIDPYAQGGSSSSMSRRAATTEGYGMFAIVDIIHDTKVFNYVDKQKIGAIGHSAGGLAAIRGAQYFGKKSKNGSKLSKLQSVYVSGMIRMGFKEKDIKKIASNVGVSYALYDEGAWQNELASGDMSVAPEMLRLINHQISPDIKLNSIDIGNYYGNNEKRTLTIVHNERVLHPFQPYSPSAMSNQIDFFQKVFSLEDSLDPDDQVWYWKELMTLISLIVSFSLIIPIAKLLIELPYFRKLKQPIPSALPRPVGTGKIVFWGTLIFSSLIACLSFVPLSELSKIFFVDASNRLQTWFFPQRMNNAIMLWALLNGTVAMILFYTVYSFYGKKSGISPSMWGIAISKKELIKTTILGIIIFFLFFLVLFLLYYLFHVDYRFMFIGVRTFRPITLVLLPMYLPLFFVFFFSNSLRVNSVMRFENDNEFRNILLSSLATASGLMLILVIQYTSLWINGTVYWKEGWLYVNLLFAIVPIMLILPFFQRMFFKMTGKVYLGPITMSLIFIMILLSNTVCYYPL